MARTGAAHRRATLVALYVAAAAAPVLITFLVRPPPSRGFWIEFGVGLGFAGLGMLGLQLALTARLAAISGPFGLDAVMQFHRQAGLVAIALVLAHVVVLVAAEPSYAFFFDPRVSLPRALALWTVLAALAALPVLTLWKRELGLTYEAWRISHALLGVLVVGLGLAHVLMVGHHVAAPWKQVLWVVMTLGAGVFLVRARLLKPLQLRRRPWRVTAIRPERGRAWRLVLEPDGHDGLRFEAGQFAWLVLGRSPFSPRENPFSFASSAHRPKVVEFIVKEAGDMTSSIGQVAPGTRAYLDGPHGGFTLDPDSERPAVLVAGGAGIVPVLSMLRTLADDGSRRRLHLVYGSPDLDAVTAREELEELAGCLDLDMHLVLENPPAGWTGAVGRPTPEVVERLIPAPAAMVAEWYTCGPPPMMDALEDWLLRRGVPAGDIHSERFDIV